MWPMGEAFAKVKAAAANIPRAGEKGEYTEEMFAADFPQFLDKDGAPHVPETMLLQFIAQANDSILPSRWGSMWRFAAGLYVAHFAALYLKTYAASSASPQVAAQSAQQTGTVKTATMGDTSISYDNTAVSSGTEKWGAWNATQYGQQLVTYARQLGMGGMYAT